MRVVALDIIRFVAALSVVLYHYVSRPESDAYPLLSEVTKFGYLGVPLFFMISGYVIALSANNRSAIQFGISRFVRLYPALWVGVIFTVVITSWLGDRSYTLPQILANFTLVNEYMGFADVDGVYWTLKTELKFYACVFLLLLFGVFQKYHIWLSAWLALTVMHAISGQPFFMGWFITPTYSSFFIAGVAFFLIQKEGVSRFIYVVLMLSLLVSSYRGFYQAEGFMKTSAIDQRLISVAVIWCFHILLYLLCTGRLRVKERKLYFILGAISYPLYLIHNMAGKAIIDEYSHVIPERILIILVIALMVFASWLIHLGVEKPLANPMKKHLLSVFDKGGKISSALGRNR